MMLEAVVGVQASHFEMQADEEDLHKYHVRFHEVAQGAESHCSR